MIKAIDFFCGAGGLTRGLLNAGIRVLAGVDNDETLRETYEKNNKPSRFICRDIKKIDIDLLRQALGITNQDVVLYAACTPCQPFSTLTRMKGRDGRKHLLIEFAKLVQQAPPDYILVENVPGLNTAYGRNIYKKFKRMISRRGFKRTYSGMLDAKNYGVPQIRKRFILLASRVGEIKQPRQRRGGTVRDCIAKYPPIRAGGKSKRLLNHEARALMPHLKKIIRGIPKDGGSRSDITDESVLLKCHRDKPTVHKDVFGRMAWDEPAPTLTCRCTDVYCGRFTHPEQNRGLSLREAAALQTFPDSYEFSGDSILQIARQIGNAVPVKLAERLGSAIVRSAIHNKERRRA
ncbi:MAG TPA: DNA cytosine methyltransferase [Verrucomicrobiae bacterium]|nr:DNA cytosine methyltransferase [Verrucomicrobiae bacterium]